MPQASPWRTMPACCRTWRSAAGGRPPRGLAHPARMKPRPGRASSPATSPLLRSPMAELPRVQLSDPGWAASYRYKHVRPDGNCRAEGRLLLGNVYQGGSFAHKVSFWGGHPGTEFCAWHGSWTVRENAITVQFHWNAVEEWAKSHNFQGLQDPTTGAPYHFCAKMERGEVHSISI